MFVITDAQTMNRALDSPIDRNLKSLLTMRRDQLLSDAGGEYDLSDLVQFVVIEPQDEIADIEMSIGFPLFSEPAFEWLQDHGGWLEGIVILSDDGFGIALFVPDHDGIDPGILSVMRDQTMQSS